MLSPVFASEGRSKRNRNTSDKRLDARRSTGKRSVTQGGKATGPDRDPPRRRPSPPPEKEKESDQTIRRTTTGYIDTQIVRPVCLVLAPLFGGDGRHAAHQQTNAATRQSTRCGVKSYETGRFSVHGRSHRRVEPTERGGKGSVPALARPQTPRVSNPTATLDEDAQSPFCSPRVSTFGASRIGPDCRFERPVRSVRSPRLRLFRFTTRRT